MNQRIRQRNVGLKYYTHKKLFLFILSIVFFFLLFILTILKPTDDMQHVLNIGFLSNLVLLIAIWFSLFFMRTNFLFIFSSNLFFLRQIVKIKKKRVTFLALIMFVISMFFFILFVYSFIYQEVSYQLIVKTFIFFLLSFSLSFKSISERLLLVVFDKIYNNKVFKEVL